MATTAEFAAQKMEILGGNTGYKSYESSVILSPYEALQKDILPECGIKISKPFLCHLFIALPVPQNRDTYGHSCGF
ncbi:MAG: hypothetical protein JRJ38_00910 [Deltaproteobacteria bacterium]|nr:hypothetical protein [Deltaproteobacteria bacterium]